MPSYVEDNWPKLSPRFREAHNRLRALRGQAPIPPPKVDLYVAPPVQAVASVPMVDDELLAQVRRAANGFDASVGRGGQGFTQRFVPEW